MDEFKNDGLEKEGENNMNKDFEAESEKLQEDNFSEDDFSFDDISKAIGSEDFSLSEDGDDVIKAKEKGKVPVASIIVVIVAIIFAVGCYFIVRHDRENEDIELITSVSAQVIGDKLFINGEEVDSEDLGLDDEELSSYADAVNTGHVQIPSSIIKKYNITTAKQTTTNAAGQTEPTEEVKEIIKPKRIYLLSILSKEYEVGQTGTINWYFSPLRTNQTGVTVSSSNPDVASIRYIGGHAEFKTLSTGVTTFTITSKVNSSASVSVSIKVVDSTTTKKIVIHTTEHTTTEKVTEKPTDPTTDSPTTPPATGGVSEIVLSGTSSITGRVERNLFVGGMTSVGYTLAPASASMDDISVSSTDTSVCTATLTSSGVKIYAVGEGTATVVVSAKSGTAAKQLISVTVDKKQ